MCCNSTLPYPLFFFASAALNAFPGLFEKDDLMVFLRRNPLAVRYLYDNQPARLVLKGKLKRVTVFQSTFFLGFFPNHPKPTP